MISMQSIANRSFHLSLSRSLSESPAPKPAANDLFDTDLDSIRSLFSTLAVSAAAETLALNKSFESRNAALWSSIEASIKEAENEKALEESRAKGLIAEKKAKEMREAEEQKVLLEKASAHEEQKRTMALAAEKRAQEVAAAALKAAAPKVVAPPKVASEGSPQADFERWTAKMTVSAFLCLEMQKALILGSTVYQNERFANRFVKSNFSKIMFRR
jgi:nucleoporin GLE1